MRANQLYRLGNYNEALLLYRAALDLYEEPVILFNIAQTYEKLRNPGEAARNFERYLHLTPRAADRAAVQRRLDKLKAEASIAVEVTSYPPGAAIFVGSREQGVRGRTPYTLSLPLGQQRILIDLSGFVPETRDIDVQLDKRNLVDVQLRRRSSIRVDADVPGAEVRIGLEAKAPQHRVPHVFEVDPGQYPLEVTLSGYHPVRQKVDVEAGEQVSLLVNLKPLPRYGTLQIEGIRGATVILEGRTLALLPMRPMKVEAGTYGVKVVREGFNTWESRVNISQDRLTVIRLDLTAFRSTATKTAIYASAGLAAGSLITGTVLGVLALRTERDYAQSESTLDKFNTGKTQALTADIFFAVAGATALVAVITYLATSRGPSTADVNILAPSEPGARP